MVPRPPQIKPIPFNEIPKSEGQTTLTFNIPYELVDIEGAYEVSLNGEIAIINLVKIQLTDHFEKLSGLRIHTSGGGKVELTNDSKGMLTITEIELIFPFITKSDYFLQVCLEYLNKFVTVWRATTGKYWLKESVSDRDIIAINFKTRRPDGTGRSGSMFSPRGKIFFPMRIRDPDSQEIMDLIKENLLREDKIPIFLKYQLNALNHFIERQFDMTIIEINIALEEYATQFLINNLTKKGVEREEILKMIDKYDNLHKLFEIGYKEIMGESLKENDEMWQEFDNLRLLRKNTIHPFVRLATYDHALEALQNYRKIRQWISSLQ